MSDENGERSSTFLGLTKVQFLGVATACFAVITGVALIFLGLQIGKNGELARQAKIAAEKNSALIDRVEANTNRVEALAEELHDTQCAQKEYAQNQVEATSDLLARGVDFSANGISRADLIASLERQRKFRDTFEKVECP